MKSRERTVDKMHCIKKWLVVVLTVILALTMTGSLTACGKKAQTEGETAIEETTDAMTDEAQKATEEETMLESEADTEEVVQEEATTSEVVEEEVETSDQNIEAVWKEEELLAAAAAQSDLDETEQEEQAQDEAQEVQDESAEDGTITICIDPGHGGSSTGTQEEYDGELIQEMVLNNKIAASLRNYLLQYSGVNVIITHNIEDDLSLSGRIQYAVSNHADYFISVHVNSRSTDEVDSSGCMVLMSCSHYQPDNTKVSSLYDMELTMARSIISKLNGIGIPIANDWNTENTGGILQRENTAGETYPDGSQADYYGLLYNGTYAGLPTIIVEHAFLSNESDYRNFLCTDAKLDALAKADAEGIAEALGLK